MSAKQMKKTKGGAATRDIEMMKTFETSMNASVDKTMLAQKLPDMSKLPKLPTR